MLELLNPQIHSAALRERIDRTEKCRAYDSRVIYLISGELTVTVGEDKPQRLAPGALFYIPAGAVYRLKSKYLRAAVISFDLVTTNSADTPAPTLPEEFDEKRLANTVLFAPFDKALYLPDAESLRDEFISITEVYTSAQGEYLASISARLKLILIRLSETLSESALPPFMVEALDGYIRENCSDEISGTEIGAIFGYHPYYVSSMLKERRGLTVKQYVTDYRIKLAKHMLAHSAKSIADISDACGFSDASYFAKIFKAQVGVSPKDYRNEEKDKFI